MWAYESVFYQIYPLGFCGAPFENDGVEVNRIQKVIDWIPHIKKLGANAIYFSPVFESDTHGYNTRDYTKIDKRLGTNADFAKVCDALHKEGIRVVLDGVFNHVGRGFWAFQDVLQNRENSRYKDWFARIDFGGNSNYNDGLWYEGWEGNYDLVKLNLRNEEVVQHIFSAIKGWIEEFDIDGLRLDVANEVSHRFCKELRARLKEINPDIYILGEIWHNALPWLRGDEFDAVMNYPLGESIKDFWIDKSQTNQDFEYTINRCYTNYMQQTNDVLFNLLDSHDTKRLRSDTKNLDQYFAQLAVLFAMPGSPCIYYGTEIAMPGGYDPDCRRCMPWDDIEAGRFKERIEMVSKLIHLRASEPLLKGRNFHFPDDFADNPRVIQFRKMGWVDTYVEVIVNCSDEDIEVPKDGEVLFERHCIDNTLLTNGILIRKIVGNGDK